MHIAHVAGALKGGPLSAVADMIKYQIAAGCQISLIYSPLRDPVHTFQSSLPPEVKVYALDIPREIHPISDYRACRELIRIFKNLDPDIVHLHSSKAGAIGRIAAMLAGIPAIYSTHAISFLRTDVGLAYRLSYFLLEWVLGFFGTMTVACSQSELRTIRAIPGSKIVIPNGINLETFPSSAALKPNNQDLRIVLCGRITAQKNPKLAVRIAQISPPTWRWLWLGDGELSEVVKGSRIQVSGWMPRENVISTLGSSDILVHTSSWEGMPIAILEGMAAGLPVVATDAVGNRDLVVHGSTGFIANDPASFLKALQTLADSSELRRKMGAAGRDTVVRDFDQTDVAGQWMELYAKLKQSRIPSCRKPAALRTQRKSRTNKGYRRK